MLRHHPNSCFRGSSAPRFLCHRLSLWPSKLCLNSSPTKSNGVSLGVSPFFSHWNSFSWSRPQSLMVISVISTWSCLLPEAVSHGRHMDDLTCPRFQNDFIGSRWFSWENLQETMVLTLKCGSQECFLFPSSMSGTKLLISRRWSQSPFQSVDLPWFLCGSWSSFMGHIDMFVGLSGTPKSHDSSSCSMELLQIRYQLFLSISGKT